MKSTTILAAVLALGSFGCSNTVRYMTATHWVAPPGQAGAASEPAPPKTDPNAPQPAAPATGVANTQRVLYVTYWEGTCSNSVVSRGCNKGDSHVKRCNVKPDNSLACVDEKEIGKVLATD